MADEATYLATLNPGELHAQGLAKLEEAGRRGHDVPQATCLGIQALAFFFASMSAQEFQEEPAGSHRAASLDPEEGRRLREAVRQAGQVPGG